MEPINFSVAVGASFPVDYPGSFIRCVSLAGGGAAPRIRVKTNNGDQVLLRGGQGVHIGRPFKAIRITNEEAAGTITGELLIGEGGFDDDRISGSVSVSAAIPGVAHTTAKKTVTNASGTMLAANASRAYLFIQNQSATGVLYIKTDGGTAVADATCVQLNPGDVYEPSVPPTGAISAIGSIASNPDIHVIEG